MDWGVNTSCRLLPDFVEALLGYSGRMVSLQTIRAVLFNAVGKLLLSICVSGSLTIGQSTSATYDEKHLPKFEDFPVSEAFRGARKPLQLSNASERMFKTRLSAAAKAPPNFAGKFRVAFWGCGSNCAAGAVIDLESGEIFSLPLASQNETGWAKWIHCAGAFGGKGDEFRLSSRLFIARCGMEPTNVTYFVWEGRSFRSVLYLPGKENRQ